MPRGTSLLLYLSTVRSGGTVLQEMLGQGQKFQAPVQMGR